PLCCGLCYSHYNCLYLFCFSFLFFETESHSVTQARVQWHHHSSQQPQTSELKRFSCLSSQVDGTIGAHQYAQLIFLFFLEKRGLALAQAGLELLTSSNPLASASQSARIPGVSHCDWPLFYISDCFICATD
uniref:Uncharacterized protein n=1 Tax=Prolemur simus TaxID=1328070 RepID=A0A8C8YZY3_PROSS